MPNTTQDTEKPPVGNRDPGDSKPATGEATDKRSPNQQRPPTDNERSSGAEQSKKEHRSNLAGDQDTEPIESEEG